MNDETDLPDLCPEVAFRIRGQMAGALAVLRQEGDLWDTSTAIQTVERLLTIGIEQADEAAELIDSYVSSVNQERRTLQEVVR